MLAPMHGEWVEKFTAPPMPLIIPEEVVLLKPSKTPVNFEVIEDVKLRESLRAQRADILKAHETALEDTYALIAKIQSYLVTLPFSTGHELVFHFHTYSAPTALLDRLALLYNMAALMVKQAGHARSTPQCDKLLQESIQTLTYLSLILNTQSVRRGLDVLSLSSEMAELEARVPLFVRDLQAATAYLLGLSKALRKQYFYHSTYTQFITTGRGVSSGNELEFLENFLVLSSNALVQFFWMPLHQRSSGDAKVSSVESKDVILPDLVRPYRHFVHIMCSCMQALSDLHAARLVLLQPNELDKWFAAATLRPEQYRGMLIGKLKDWHSTLTILTQSRTGRSALSALRTHIQKAAIPIAIQEQQALTATLAPLSSLLDKLNTYNNNISHDPISNGLTLRHLTIPAMLSTDDTPPTHHFDLVREDVVLVKLSAAPPPSTSLPHPSANESFFDRVRRVLPGSSSSNSGRYFIGGNMVKRSNSEAWEAALATLDTMIHNKRPLLKGSNVPDYVIKEVVAREATLHHLLTASSEMPALLLDAVVATLAKEAESFYTSALSGSPEED